MRISAAPHKLASGKLVRHGVMFITLLIKVSQRCHKVFVQSPGLKLLNDNLGIDDWRTSSQGKLGTAATTQVTIHTQSRRHRHLRLNSYTYHKTHLEVSVMLSFGIHLQSAIAFTAL